MAGWQAGAGNQLGTIAALAGDQWRDGRLQAAQLRFGQIEPPAIGIEHVLDDGEPEAGAIAALVESAAALEHARPLGGRKSCAIIFDDDRRSGTGDDADAMRGMARGILQQIAQHLGEIGTVERHQHIVANL